MEKFADFGIKSIINFCKANIDGKYDYVKSSKIYDGFILVLGDGGYAVINKKRYELKKGTLILLLKGYNYELHFTKNRNSVSCDFYFHFDENSEFTFEIPCTIECSEKQIHEIHDMYNTWTERSYHSYTACRAKLTMFLLNIFKDHVKLETNLDSDMQLAVKYIHENFKHNFSTQDIAKRCSLSEQYLRSKFLKQTGRTITQYRDKLRLTAAKEMLECGYFNISEIASELGYCDVYHFSKFFKCQTKLSPRTYVKQFQNIKD